MDLEDRMKVYEGVEAQRRLMPLLPAFARLDGKNFHKFTRDFHRPYDPLFGQCMLELAKYLVEETGARCAYTQSDEITLVWQADDFKSQIYFDGRVQKMASVLAAKASVMFNEFVKERFSREIADRLPVFDCRVWNVPSWIEAVNVFLWRQQDAARNSVSMAAHHHYGHNELQDKNTAEMQEMLHQKGVNWNDYPPHFKRGTFFQRRKVLRPYTPEEINKLPPPHEARFNPELKVQRSEVRLLFDAPPLLKMVNRREVIFDGADPIVKDEDKGQQAA